MNNPTFNGHVLFDANDAKGRRFGRCRCGFVAGGFEDLQALIDAHDAWVEEHLGQLSMRFD